MKQKEKSNQDETEMGLKRDEADAGNPEICVPNCLALDCVQFVLYKLPGRFKK